MVVSSLGCGGYERICAHLSEGFHKKGALVTVITYLDGQDFFTLSSNITRIHVGYDSDSKIRRIRRLLRIRREILNTKPDVVLTFGYIDNIRIWLASRGTNIPFIFSEHIYPEFGDRFLFWRLLRRLIYPQAQHVICVSRGIMKYFPWLKPDRVSVIYNPIVPEGFIEPDDELLDRPKVILAMGRLVRQKGFDILLRAFHRIVGNFPSWKLLIYGNGEKLNDLLGLRKILGLEEHVEFKGITKDPFLEFVRGQIFVLSSRMEGFGNVLVEAMSCGLAVISFDCMAGPAEIILRPEQGLLVPPKDEARLANALSELMSNETRRRVVARNGQIRSRDFSVENSLEKYWRVINHVNSKNTERTA